MISAGWIIPILLLGITAGICMAFTAGGSKASKCEECPYKLAKLGNKNKPPVGGSSIKLVPPVKHIWEITHVDRPTRVPFRKNSRLR